MFYTRHLPVFCVIHQTSDCIPRKKTYFPTNYPWAWDVLSHQPHDMATSTQCSVNNFAHLSSLYAQHNRTTLSHPAIFGLVYNSVFVLQKCHWHWVIFQLPMWHKTPRPTKSYFLVNSRVSGTFPHARHCVIIKHLVWHPDLAPCAHRNTEPAYTSLMLC